MKLRTAIALSLVIWSAQSYSSPLTDDQSAKKARSEAVEAAKEAKTAAQKAFEAANQALEISTKEESKKMAQEFRTAVKKTNAAAKFAVAKIERAFEKSMTFNKDFAARASQEAKNAVTETETALQKTEDLLKAESDSNGDAIKNFASKSKIAIQKTVDATKQTFLSAEASANAVIKETSNAIKSDLETVGEETKEYTIDQKKQVQDRYHQDINKLDNQIGKLKEEIKTKNEAVQGKLNDQVIALEKQRDEAKEKLGRLSNANNVAWKDLKYGVEVALKKMKVSFRKARADFKRER